jgi:glycosyltransferase involved in cell wall biosynthesis
MRKVRVLQIVKGLDIGGLNGGAERFSIDLSEQLMELGFEVDLCAFYKMNTSAEKDWLEKIQSKGLEVFFVTSWSGPNNFLSYAKGVKALQRFVKSKGYIILHSHFQQGTYAALLLKKKFNIPVVLRTAHNVCEWEAGFRGKFKEAISNLIYPKRLDAEVGVSQAIVKELSRRYPYYSDKLRPILIHNGIQLPSIDEGCFPKATEKGNFIIGSVGRLAEQKGYTYLIAALPKVLRIHPEATMVLLGDGELRSQLEAQVMQLDLQNQVEVTGQVNNVLERLEGFDLFVSSSLWEGLPTVIMEAMAIGVPVIATDIPGSREMISHKINGWLVAPADASSLANAICELIENPLLRQEIGKAGKQLVRQYSIQEIAKSYKQLYETLLTGSGKNG